METKSNILVVEDESIISLNISYILERIGYNIVGICNTADKALATLRNKSVDLVLMDIKLSGHLDGIEIAEIISNEHDVPVIFLTAYHSEDIFSRAKNTNPYAFIIKPFTDRELEINIELVLLRHKSDKNIRFMHAALEKTNLELEKKVQLRTRELEKINIALREEIDLGHEKSNALEQSEKDYRGLFENSQDAILIVDPVYGIIKRINKAACDLYGFTEAEFLDLKISQLYFNDPENTDYFELIENRGINNSFESVHRKRSGQLIYAEISVSAIRFKKDMALQFFIRDVTERKNAEWALQNSEKRYRDMTNFLPICIFETNTEGVITYSNSTANALFEYKQEELVDKISLIDLIAPGDKPRFRQLLEPVTAAGSNAGITCTALKKTAVEIKVIGYSTLFSNDEVWQGMRICLIDIGDLTQTQQQLMKFSMVIEQISESVIITNQHGKIEYVNPAFLSEYGYSSSEVLGKLPSFLKSNHHNLEFYKNLWNTIGSGNIFNSEFINKKKDGGLYYEDKTITPLRDSTGQIAHYVSTGRNILEKKNSEKKIFEHQRFIDAINNTVPLIVFVYDIQKKTYTFINNKICPILGYSPEEFTRMNIHEFIELVHPNDRKILPSITGQENYADDNVSQVVLKIRHKSGEYRIMQFRGVSFVRNANNSVEQILGTAQDVTEQKYHERRLDAMMRLHRLQEKKEQKIRTFSVLQGQEEERRRLSRDMHDGIGQLMTAIKMKLDNLQKRVETLAPEIEAGITDTNKIVKHTINEVRRISNDLVPIGLYDFGLSSVLRQLLENIPDKKISFHANIGLARFPSAVEITFYRVFQETINNMQKHSGADAIDVSLVFSNNLLEMIIVDNGVGFTFNDQHPVTFIGKGNGLNNMYERARTIGGKYSILSAPGKGCRTILEVNVKPITI